MSRVVSCDVSGQPSPVAVPAAVTFEAEETVVWRKYECSGLASHRLAVGGIDQGQIEGVVEISVTVILIAYFPDY